MRGQFSEASLMVNTAQSYGSHHGKLPSALLSKVGGALCSRGGGPAIQAAQCLAVALVRILGRDSKEASGSIADLLASHIDLMHKLPQLSSLNPCVCPRHSPPGGPIRP